MDGHEPSGRVTPPEPPEPGDRLEEIRQRYAVGLPGAVRLGQTCGYADVEWLFKEVERLRKEAQWHWEAVQREMEQRREDPRY